MDDAERMASLDGRRLQSCHSAIGQLWSLGHWAICEECLDKVELSHLMLILLTATVGAIRLLLNAGLDCAVTDDLVRQPKG